MEIATPFILATMVAVTPNKQAHEKVLIATYKQSGFEQIVNKNINEIIDKDYQKMIQYSYQISQMVKNKEVVFGFSF